MPQCHMVVMMMMMMTQVAHDIYSQAYEVTDAAHDESGMLRLRLKDDAAWAEGWANAR